MTARGPPVVPARLPAVVPGGRHVQRLRNRIPGDWFAFTRIGAIIPRRAAKVRVLLVPIETRRGLDSVALSVHHERPRGGEQACNDQRF